MNEQLSAERALVGAVLANPRHIRDIEVAANDFADVKLEAIWGLMLWLDSQRMPADAITVQQNLSRVEVRGIDGIFLADLLSEAPIGPLTNHYAQMIVENAVRRRLSQAGQRIQQLAASGENSQDIVEQARKELDASSRAVSGVTMIGEEIDETLTMWESPEPNSVPTPWVDLNHVIHGWRPGALYVVGARPAVGKSLMGLQAAIGLAKHGHVAFHSLEMPREEVHMRVVAQMAPLQQDVISRRKFDDSHWLKVAQVRAEIDALKLSIDDRSSIRPVDIRSYARSLTRKGPLAGIVVDYLQLMSSGTGDKRNRQEQVADWSRSLKILAMELKVPVIVLSQLNRGPATRMDKRPEMSDLRESGAIEQDADVILLLHVDEDEDPSKMLVNVVKNRGGGQGSFPLHRRGDLARLDNSAWRQAS